MSATPDSDSEHDRMMAPRGPIEYLRANADGMRNMSPSELSQYHRNLEAEPSALSRINLRHERSPMPSGSRAGQRLGRAFLVAFFGVGAAGFLWSRWSDFRPIDWPTLGGMICAGMFFLGLWIGERSAR